MIFTALAGRRQTSFPLFGDFYFLSFFLKMFEAIISRFRSTLLATVPNVVIVLPPFRIILVQELRLGVRLLIFPQLRVGGELTTDLFKAHGF